MNFIEIDRNDGGSFPITVTEDDVAVDLSVMDLEGSIEWHGGSMTCTIANGRLAENDTTPLTGGVVDLVISDADAEAISVSKLPFFTLRDVTEGTEQTIIERIALRLL